MNNNQIEIYYSILLDKQKVILQIQVDKQLSIKNFHLHVSCMENNIPKLVNNSQSPLITAFRTQISVSRLLQI